MKLIIFQTFIILSITVDVSESSGFVIVAPKVFLVGSIENVCISLHNRTTGSPISISLFHTTTEDVIARVQSIVENNTSCIPIDVPWTSEVAGRLRVQLAEGESNLIVTSEKSISFSHQPLITIISPDKPVYRPGDIIRLRILTLTHHLRISNLEIQKVWIESPTGIVLEQWNAGRLRARKGLIQIELLLSEESFLGDWKVKVEINSRFPVSEKVIPVRKYELPKFEVDILQPNNILADAEYITFEACAKYAYGAPVQGEIIAEISVIGELDQNRNNSKVVMSLTLDSPLGCTVFNVSGVDLSLSDSRLQVDVVEIMVTVTESGSMLYEKASRSWKIHHKAVQLQFHCSQYFKPGLPYRGKIAVIPPYFPSVRVENHPIQICLRQEGALEETNRFEVRGASQVQSVSCWNYSTDINGEIQFTLPPLLNSSNALFLTAASLEQKDKFYPGEHWNLLMVQPKAYQPLKAWFSPSQSYIDVTTVMPVSCNKEYNFNVQYTVENFSDSTPMFTYLVESKGDLLRIGSYKPEKEFKILHKMAVGFPPAKSFKLPLRISPDMSPESKFIIYYSRPDGEIVAASMIVLVDRCFPNKVSTRWSQYRVEPGSNITLSIRAAPNSLCATNILDSRSKDSDGADIDLWEKMRRFSTNPLEDSSDYCLNGNAGNGLSANIPPDWELRRRRRSLLIPQVDAKTAFDDLGVVIITDLTLETRPCHTYNVNNSRVENSIGRKVALREHKSIPLKIEMENSLGSIMVDSSNYQLKDRLELRNNFPESWLWAISVLEKSGEIIMKTKVPHTITGWKASVACVHEESGFGMNEMSDILQTFQSFHLDLDMPVSIKRSEEVKAKVIIYNRNMHRLPVKIIISTTSGIQAEIIGENIKCIGENSVSHVEFSIKGIYIGQNNLTVSASIIESQDSTCWSGYSSFNTRADSIMKSIKVELEGFQIIETHSALLNWKDHPSHHWNISIPNNIIKGSAQAIISISSNLLGPISENLENLIELPVGCGEQNMIKLAPALQLMKYLNAVNPPGTTHLRGKVLSFIQKGYQRQLLYRHSDGSYSAFGPGVNLEEGSIWLTALAVKYFGQARDFILVDEKHLQQSFDWIITKQLKNGCFPALGRIFNKHLMRAYDDGNNEPNIRLTAFVVAALLQSGLAIPKQTKSNAKICLSRESQTDVYSLSLVTYAFALMNDTLRANEQMQRLLKRSKSENGLLWWESSDLKKAANVEITSYATLSMLLIGGSEYYIKAFSAVLWLSSQRNIAGGFYTSQDTVIGLETLAKYAIQFPQVDHSMMIQVQSANGKINNTLSIDENNELLSQRIKLIDLPSTIYMKLLNEGSAFVQAQLKYNLVENTNSKHFILNATVTTLCQNKDDNCARHELETCIRTNSSSDSSDMTVIMIYFITGFNLDRNSIHKISGIKRWEKSGDESSIVIYLEEVSEVPFCFSFTTFRRYETKATLPGRVIVYDYYNPENTEAIKYSIPQGK